MESRQGECLVSSREATETGSCHCRDGDDRRDYKPRTAPACKSTHAPLPRPLSIAPWALALEWGAEREARLWPALSPAVPSEGSGVQTGGIWDHSGSKSPDWAGSGGESGEHLAFGSQCPLLSAADQRPVTLATLGSLLPASVSFSEPEVKSRWPQIVL